MSFALLGASTFDSSALAEAEAANVSALTLSNLVQQVIERNEMLQAKLFDYNAARSRERAEHGIFEPEAFATATRQVNNRINSSEQKAATGVSVLRENNRIYEGGLEALALTGARVRVGLTVNDIFNNVPTTPLLGSPITNHQYQTFAGLTVAQPLLKNFGSAATMAGIRLAARTSRISFEEYRKQMMELVSQTEATYWGLYFAQEQVRFFEDSVKTADTILRDNRARLEAGKVSDLEVLEAESAVGLRRAKLNEARQKVVEALNRVLLLYAESPSGPELQTRAADIPLVTRESTASQELWRNAFVLNPDYLIQREKLEQELIRLGYARNQRLPELDAKGAFGFYGYGLTPSESFSALESRNYDSWSIGLELRVPLGGGVKSRNELAAVRAQLESARLTLRSIENEIFNSLDTATHKVESARSSVEDYRSSVNYNQRLLDSALVRLDAGKTESRKVLEIEADLFAARNAVAESLVRFKIAQLELELTQGTILKNRNLEITQDGLEQTTRQLVSGGKTFNAQFQRRFDKAGQVPANDPNGRLRQALDEKLDESSR